MPAIEIKPDIHWIGVNDRTTDLFEGLWPISREGISYNSYLVKDEKTAIIDLSKAFKTDDYIAQIAQLTDLHAVDYIVVNHVEPDHTGVLRVLKEITPTVTILSTAKGCDLLNAYYGLGSMVRAVEDGQTLDLGRRQLKFVSTPFVHWPETMMTYDDRERILFSCDGFGGYGALSGAIFDDECADLDFYEQESLRYYVNVVAKFRAPVLKAIDKLADVPVDIVCPSHGLIWRKNPERIFDLYRIWSKSPDTAGELGATLLYGSMYGNTETLMNAVAEGIAAEGVDVAIFDAARVHSSYVTPSLWTRAGVVIGSPTYEGSLFPPVAEQVRMAALKSIMNRRVAMFGSYGWRGGALGELKKIVGPLKWEFGESLMIRGGAKRESVDQAKAFGRNFAQWLKKSVSDTPGQD